MILVFATFIILYLLFKHRVLFYKQNVLIIIISCPRDYKTPNLNKSLLPFDVEILICNRISNAYDAREAGLMLDYIIKNYKRKKYNKLLFIHDHDKSVHYPFSITKRINLIHHYNYIYKYDFMGVNCNYIQFNVGNKYENIFHEVEKIDYYLTEKGIEHVNMSIVHDKKYLFPCCASFFVNTKLIYIHPLNYYVRLRNALRNFSLFGFSKFISNNYLKMKYRNHMAGGYMEFTWSTMLGQKNVSLPPDCIK